MSESGVSILLVSYTHRHPHIHFLHDLFEIPSDVIHLFQIEKLKSEDQLLKELEELELGWNRARLAACIYVKCAMFVSPGRTLEQPEPSGVRRHFKVDLLLCVKDWMVMLKSYISVIIWYVPGSRYQFQQFQQNYLLYGIVQTYIEVSRNMKPSFYLF